MTNCKACEGPGTTHPDSCGTESGTMQVCYPNSTPSPPWQGNVPGCCGPVPDRWNKRFGDYLSNSLQQGAGGRQRLTPEQANCMVYGVAKYEQSPRGIVNTLADSVDHQREFAQILEETEACCLDKSPCNRDRLDGRQPGVRAYAEPLWASESSPPPQGGCQGTEYGCCHDGKTYATSQNDPCKKAHSSVLPIVLSVSLLMLLGAVGVGVWMARKRKSSPTWPIRRH
jgi:hypothetical protein